MTGPGDVGKVVRALEDFLLATTPKSKPQPPEKSPAQLQLERLLAELAKAPPAQPAPAPEPEPFETALAQEVQAPEENTPAAPVPPAPPVPRMPEPPLESAPEETPSLTPRPRKTIAIRRALLAAALAGAIAGLHRARSPLPRAASAPAPRPTAPAAAMPRSAPAVLAAPPSSPETDGDRAIALVLAYRPLGGRLCAAQIFRSMAGDPIPQGDWELRPGAGGRLVVRFVPYARTLGENYAYQFSVSVNSGQVSPTAQTQERLRVDALGRLAGRSDLQAFWQLLDLPR